MRLARLVRQLGSGCVLFPADPAPLDPAGNDPELHRLRFDSRELRPGDLYAALPGVHHSAERHLEDALRRGAAAVFRVGPARPLPLPQLVVPQSSGARELAGRAASLLAERPSAAMWCAGITGTNGKSTVVHLLQHALDAAARPCARIGTLGMDFDGRTERTPNTTPGADRIHDWLDRARHAGAVCCVLEASSHGLDQERLAGMELDAAGWTNLSRDHLDYHSSWAAYAAAKARLFARLPQDAPAFLPAAAPSIEAACQGTAARLHSFGLDAPDAALCGRWTPGADGGLLEIHGSFGKATVSTSLIGRHNAENLLLSFGLLRCAGLSAAEAAAGLAAAQAPPGRLQAVARESPWRLYVDYAHTPDALRHVLASLREAFPERRIGVLCGAGGDRDHGKRPPMGRAAAEGSDWCVLTSDNPRSEDPKAILEAVVAGARPVGRELHAIVDRREAIRFAVSRLRPGDVLLVAGKGHEDYQEIDGRRLPFDDRLELEEAARCWT